MEIDPMYVVLLENIFQDIMIYNSQGKLLYACDKFWEETGFTKSEFEGKGIVEISGMKLYNPYAAERVLKTGKKVTIVQKTFVNDITVATAIPITGRDGKLLFIVAYAENNERILELERKLRESDKFIQEKNEKISQLLNHIFVSPPDTKRSKQVLKIHRLIEKVADFDANILLTGETGVGKTMYAEKIHLCSKRGTLPFIEINCATIPEMLLESELFGYEKGAFTGASEKGKVGQIELAAGGTLFLDEISEMSINLQSKLLQVIQSKKIMRIGGIKPIEVDFRLIAASNKNLQELVEKGLFREDLYYRLNVIPIQVPPLRERREDISLLSNLFLNEFNMKYGKQKYFNERVKEYFGIYEWPGNVRELQNLIERLVLTTEEEEITYLDLPENVIRNTASARGSWGLRSALENLEEDILTKAYNEYKGNISAISRKLNISRQSLLRRIEKYDIPNDV